MWSMAWGHASQNADSGCPLSRCKTRHTESAFYDCHASSACSQHHLWAARTPHCVHTLNRNLLSATLLIHLVDLNTISPPLYYLDYGLFHKAMTDLADRLQHATWQLGHSYTVHPTQLAMLLSTQRQSTLPAQHWPRHDEIPRGQWKFKQWYPITPKYFQP